MTDEIRKFVAGAKRLSACPKPEAPSAPMTGAAPLNPRSRCVGQQPLLTVKDLARMLRLSERTIRRWIADGTLPTVRLGRSVRVRPEALDQFIGPT